MQQIDTAGGRKKVICLAARPPMGSRRWLIGAALIALSVALYAGWDWLAALGLTTALIAFAPCLAMCALALCMRQKTARPNDKEDG